MAREILAIPEQHLEHVVLVIQAGLRARQHDIPIEVSEGLADWCDQQVEYLERCKADEPSPPTRRKRGG